MIYFKCSKCGEPLEAPDSMVNELLQCPKCNFPETIPQKEEEPLAISLEPETQTKSNNEPSQKISTFESESKLDLHQELKRPLQQSGQGATRVRTFHARLSNSAMTFLDNQINEWVDQDENIEIKFTNITVGMVEGKKTEPHLIITVWY